MEKHLKGESLAVCDRMCPGPVAAVPTGGPSKVFRVLLGKEEGRFCRRGGRHNK